jgi:hypothetical protein
MDPTKWPDEPMSREVKGGRGPLLAAAVLHVIGCLILGNSVGDSDPAAIRDAFRMDAGINLCLGPVFFGIWYWARHDPLNASSTGLGLFLLIHVGKAIAVPATILIGLVTNLIILVFLIRSVLAAKAAEAWDEMEKAKS